MSKTVFVGLSGGVDSGVSAALLKQKGFQVVGVFIKIWQPEFTECTWAVDRLDAMRVCVTLGIPFKEIDLSAEYKKMVVEDMLFGYAQGITPNPDVLCNRHIKFGSFMKYAFAEGADYIATGHYARIRQGFGGQARYELLRGMDKGKDQTYFLYLLNQNDLAHTLFPVGGLQKKEVRGLARKFALPVAHKSDSQGLCFVGDVTMKDFLSRYIKLEGGNVLNESGTIIGKHDGAALYTIGQRHGFTIEYADGNKVPHFVSSVDIPSNTISVSARRESATSKEVLVDKMNWISGQPVFPMRAQIQARYREDPINATLTLKSGKTEVVFDNPQIAAPGQSLVVYAGEKCLGGGTILK